MYKQAQYKHQACILLLLIQSCPKYYYVTEDQVNVIPFQMYDAMYEVRRHLLRLLNQAKL